MSVIPWDPYQQDCPSRRLLDRIGDRWTVLIVGALDPGPQRFGALAARVGGISQKMLAQTCVPSSATASSRAPCSPRFRRASSTN